MLEKYEKEISKIEEPTGPEWQPTLKDILGDKEKSSLFGEMLSRDNDAELATRMANAELSEDDIAELEERRTSFNETMKSVELVKKTITPESLAAFARNDPNFEKILKLVGPESAVNIYKKQIAGLSIVDPDRFNMLSSATQNYDSYVNGEWKDLDESVKTDLKKYKINESSFVKAIAMEDEGERAGALRGAVRDGYNWFQKSADWVSAGSLSKNRVEIMEANKELIDIERGTLQQHRGQVGSMLAMSIEENQNLRKALSQELIGDKIETPPTEGFKEMKSAVPTKEAFTTAWSAYKKQLPDWDTMGDPEKDLARDKFIQSQQEGFSKKSTKEGGFWSSIFGALFGAFSTSNKNELN